jgi:hypothetical protein
MIDATGAVTGKLRRQQDGHNAPLFRNSFNLKEDAYIEKLKNENNKIEIQEYSRTNQKNLLYQLLKESLSKYFSEIIGGKFTSNHCCHLQVQNPFKQENREYPIDFDFLYG